MDVLIVLQIVMSAAERCLRNAHPASCVSRPWLHSLT